MLQRGARLSEVMKGDTADYINATIRIRGVESPDETVTIIGAALNQTHATD
jgi:endonuclease YncB( thermonuclease family)